MHILYVEDDPRIREQTLTVLRSEGHTVTAFDNTVAALNHVRGKEPDLLLCDYRLGGGPHGLELAGRVRQLYPSCAIVMLSHYADIDDVVEAIQLEVDDFVRRPVHFRELLARMWGAFQRRRARHPLQRTPLLQSGPLSIEAQRRAVIWHGAPLALTPTEFSLLEQLVLNQGEILTFVDLCALVWGERMDHKYARKRVKPHMLKLRLKLEQDGRRESGIHSVRGRGYRWSPPHTPESGESTP